MEKVLSVKKYFFIVNPVSGKGKGITVIEQINNEFGLSGLCFEVHKTEYAKHARILAGEAIQKGFNVIVAAGGDGTVNEVASVVAGSSVCMGIIPIGSGNGLAREMNIPMSAKAAISLLKSGFSKKIDTGTCNDHFFACTAGVGFDAHLANKFLTTEIRGLKGYARLFLTEFFNYKGNTYEIELNGTKINTCAFLLTIANCRQWGNDFFISPKSKPDDGQFEICVIRKFPIFLFPVLLYRIVCKTIHKSIYFESFRSSAFKITSNTSGNFHTDGEVYDYYETLSISLNKSSLSIITG